MSQQATIRSDYATGAPLADALAQRLGVPDSAGWWIVPPGVLDSLIRDALPAVESAERFAQTRLARWLESLGGVQLRFWYADLTDALDHVDFTLVDAVRRQLIETRSTGGEIYLRR